MHEDLKEFIKNLSEIYDVDSEDTFVSLYINKKDDEKFLQRRIKAIRSILKGELLKNFDETIKKIKNILSKIPNNNIAIFASAKNDFLKYTSLSVKIKNLLIVDSSPYIRPLARILDEWESFSLLLISSNYAKIFSIDLGHIKDEKSLSKDVINKHKKGGWSQARFNRIRKGQIHDFLKEVIEALQKRDDELIIIAGPGVTKHQFVEMLPQSVSNKILDVVDISIDDEKEILKKSIYLISEKEDRKSHEAVNHLKEEILKDGLAVYGIEETLNAVKNGQVELLIIQKDIKIKGWICEKCQVVKKGLKLQCPYCDEKTSRVDVLEEILEFAERTDAEIEFTDDEEIANLGHIGAILRYK